MVPWLQRDEIDHDLVSDLKDTMPHGAEAALSLARSRIFAFLENPNQLTILPLAPEASGGLEYYQVALPRLGWMDFISPGSTEPKGPSRLYS